MKKTNWWVWERPATIHIIYTGAMGAEHELKLAHGRPYAKTLYGFFRNGMVRWICDFDLMIQNGIDILPDLTDSKKYQSKLDRWNELTKKITNQINKINSIILAELTDQKLWKIYHSFDQIYLKWWGYTQVAELVSYGGEAILKKHLSESEFKKSFAILMAPTKKSYTNFEEEEIFEIVNLAKKYGIDDRIVKEKISDHSKKYHWILNSFYDSVRLSEKHFQQEILNLLNKNVNLEKLKNNNEKRLRKIRKEKQQLIKNLKFNKTLAKIVWILDDFCYLQDQRKAVALKASGVIDSFTKEVSRRKNIDYKIVRWATPHQFELIIKNKKIDINQIKKQGKNCLIIFSDQNNQSQIYTDKEALKKEKEILGRKLKFDEVAEFEGNSANAGKVIGKVRKILSAKEIDKMQTGEVLVSTMTSPDFISAMKKAGAIITDDGGITCHAAIVARELKKPCIIGTKIATKFFKDGDLVEVDAEHGKVRKINE